MNRLLLVALAAVSAPAMADPLPAAPHVYVQGSAEIRVEPDTIQLWIAIQATDPQLAAAKATVDERTRKLIAACKGLGIGGDDITTAGLQIGPDYDYREEKRVLVGTRASREIELTLHELDRYSDLIQALVSAEIGEIRSTTLSSTTGAKVLDEAQQKALADARARAERLAAASGQALGAAWSISEFDQRVEERYRLSPERRIGSRQSRPHVAYDALGAEQSEPFEPGTIVANAVVYVVYLLEPK